MMMAEKEDETLEGFRGEYSFLSNMYECECEYRGQTFKTSEHLYQYLKIDPNSPDAESWQERMIAAPTGKKAKTLTRKNGFPFRPVEDLDDFRLRAMKVALWAKFSQPHMAKKLLVTKDTTLVEYNNHGDEFFGICRGVGHNHLGRLLMELRMYLRNQPEYQPKHQAGSSFSP